MAKFPKLLVPSVLCLLLTLLAAIPALGAPAADQSAELLSLAPSRDNTLIQHPTDQRSNGMGERFFVGRNAHGQNRRAVIAFDVASLPAGAEIVSATLVAHMSRSKAGPQTISLHRMVADWGEGTSNAAENEGSGAAPTRNDATWMQPFFGRDFMWKTPGGDFVPDGSATTTVDAPGRYAWGPTAHMTADIQSWLDAPDANFGWLLLGKEDAPQTTKRFDSKDHADAAQRPMLVISYTAQSTDETLIYLPIAARRSHLLWGQAERQRGR